VIETINDIMSYRRAIHFVLKIGKRNEAVGFYKNVLGMKVSGHWAIQYTSRSFGIVIAC